MTTDLSASLQDIKDSRKTAVINDELKRLNVDIATLRETRLADSGTLKEKDYTFFWQGKRSNEPREHGVGFAVRNSLLRMVEPGCGCTFHDLCITNSFRTTPQHKASWRHPRSKHWHQLDLILVRQLLSRMFSTHALTTVRTVIQTTPWCAVRSGCKPKKFHHTKGIPRIDVSKMSQPDLTEQFAQTFDKEFGSLQPGDSATEKWEALRDTMYCTALATFGKRSSKSHDWFEAKSTVMTPVIEAKRAALAEYKRTPSERNLQILKIARS